MLEDVFYEVMVGRGGLEPPTSRLSGVRSNHLSYRPSVRQWRARRTISVSKGCASCASV